MNYTLSLDVWNRDFFNLHTMSLTKEKKAEVLKVLVQKMKDAKSVIFADFQGLPVKDMKILRRELMKEGASLQVAKKTLIRIAAKEIGHTEIPDEVLEGPVSAVFSLNDEIVAAKLIYNFGKKNKNLKLRGALLDGKVLSVAETKELAMLPSKIELIAKFIYVIKSPLSGFHGVLNNTIAGFVRALNAIREKREQTV